MSTADVLRQLPATILLVALGLPVAAADQDSSFRTADGVAVYLGILPAAMVRGHAADDANGEMHGGPPRGRDTYHVTVALFDAGSGERIETTAVEARVALRGSRGTTRALEPMRIADTITFGNYFTMRGEGPYDIEVTFAPPGQDEPVTVRFSHSPADR
jgi:hypothetical protein